MFTDPFPSGMDAVLFSHVLEIFSADQARFLVAKAFEALPAGGRLFLFGYRSTESEDGGVLAARLSLYFNVLASGEGMAYPPGEYEDWSREAGCTDIRSYTGLPYEHGLTVGTR